LAVWGLARKLGASPLAAGIAALIQSVSFLFPFDFQVWGGWPLGMGVVLALGTWTVALAWLEKPLRQLALGGGVLLGALIVTHGTELYTVAVGLAVIAVLRMRVIYWRALAAH